MTTDQKIQLIGQKIWVLSNDLEKYRAELELLKQQLAILTAQKAAESGAMPPVQPPNPVQPVPPVVETKQEKPVTATTLEPAKVQPVNQTRTSPPRTSSFNLEEYIGGNVIAKIGIVVLVVGLGIGVKYAIDRELISELTRVVLGYTAGAVLLGIAFRLKKNFEAFSAVLLSGAMATLYFTTFAAYNFYGLIGQVPAFGIMVVFTAFTVFAATIYNQQWIGIFGLAGAYAIPMLLDENSGKAHIMFTYMSIINAGVLVLSFKKYWRALTWVAYSLSWLIFSGWFLSRYTPERYINTALVFSFIFFISFYLSLIAYKTIKKEQFNFGDIVLVLLNSFIFFSFGFAVVSDIQDGKYLGLFTLGNSLIHLLFAYSVFINKQVDRKLFYLVMALVLTFATIAVPIQLEGHWVTLFWLTEMLLLFWVGRIKQVRFYEWMAFAMVLLGIGSLLEDWSGYFLIDNSEGMIVWTPLLNNLFLASAVAMLTLGGVIYLDKKYPLPDTEHKRYSIYSITNYVLPVSLSLVAFFAFFNEISAYFDVKLHNTAIVENPRDAAWGATRIYDTSLYHFKSIWLVNYVMLFMFSLGVIVRKVWRDEAMRWAVLFLEILAIILFLTAGLTELSTLRSEYITSHQDTYFPVSNSFIYVRYICYTFLGLLMYNLWNIYKTSNSQGLKIFLQPFLHVVFLVVLSSELTNVIVLTNPEDPYHYEDISHKMGYTILWGLYSFALVAIGIMRKNKVLRIFAISLFALTLIKLFAFDIIDLSTGYKIAAFIALGVILLVVAFMYQKFKNIIFGNDEPR